MEKEIWKDITGFNGSHLVSNFGRIKSCTSHGRGIIMKQRLNGCGYPSLEIYVNKKKKKILVHRIVAKTFIPNPQNKRTVNHINGDKTDNRVENLEWMSYSENHIHSYKYLDRKGGQLNKRGFISNRGKVTKVYNSKYKLIGTYGSALDAGRKTKTSYPLVYYSIKHNVKTKSGLYFKYSN